jgi:hypothetical protein
MSSWGRLNLFQRMMLRWRDLHAYNPVHVVRVPAVLEAERLRACIARQLESLGLTGLVVDPPRWRYRYEGGSAVVELGVAAGGSDPRAELSRTIERELNRPFPVTPRPNPFRFFAIDEGGAFQLTLVYDHFVASGDSIARLLTGIACAMASPEAPSPTIPLERHSATYRSLFLRHPSWVLRAIAGLPRTVATGRRAYRPRYDKIEDADNGYRYLRVEAPQLSALLGAAKTFGVTLNELLMACLLLALSPLAAERRRSGRRKEMAVASIMNIRGDFGLAAQAALSPFLAAVRVPHLVPEGISLRQLALDVHDEMRRVRRGHLYLQSLMVLGVSALLWPWLTVSRRHGLYPKHFPVWAGITSLNVNAIWAETGGADVSGLDYLRAVPTGPLCPMVFAVTTAHDLLHVGIAFRTTAFSRATVDALAEAFSRNIERLGAEASP